jgi:hypothetical protein
MTAELGTTPTTSLSLLMATTVGLITDNDETAYREVRDLTVWCKDNNLSLNVIRKALQRVVHTAQYVTGVKLSAIQDLYTRQCQRKALKIVKDSSHPSHRLFSLLLHGKGYRSAKSRSKRLLNSFHPQAIRPLNS